MPEFTELLMDEEPVVREAAVESILGLLTFFDSETRLNTVIPMWKKLCEDKIGHMPNLIAKSFGLFMYNIRSNTQLIKDELNDADRRFFLASYQSMCTSNNKEIMEHAAFNFPAVVMVIKPQNFEGSRLDKALDVLVMSDFLNVKKSIASGLHEVYFFLSKVANQLKTHSYHALKDSFVKLILSKNEPTICAILSKFNPIMKHFATDESSKLVISLFNIGNGINILCNHTSRKRL